MESLVLMIIILMLIVLLLPWNVLLFLKLTKKFKAPTWLKAMVLIVSFLEFLGWLVIYLNFILNTNFLVSIVISFSWIGFYLSFKEFRAIIKELKSK